MTQREGRVPPWVGIIVAIVFILSACLILSIVAWAIYSPIPYEAEFDRMVEVNTTGLEQVNFTYQVLGGTDTGSWGSYQRIIHLTDREYHKYYHVRVVEKPDYGAALPIGPKEVVNTTGYNSPVLLTHILNGCTLTKIIVTTENSYFIQDFPQTMICG